MRLVIVYYTNMMMMMMMAMIKIFYGSGNAAFSHVTATFINMPFNKEDRHWSLSGMMHAPFSCADAEACLKSWPMA